MIVGVDMTHVQRLRSLIARYPAMETRFFTERERKHCHRHSDPVLHLAGTFAAKEAVVKTLGLGHVVAWARRIEIVRDVSGAPTALVTNGSVPDKLAVSISHDADIAIAVAISTGPRLTTLAEGACGSDFP